MKMYSQIGLIFSYALTGRILARTNLQVIPKEMSYGVSRSSFPFSIVGVFKSAKGGNMSTYITFNFQFRDLENSRHGIFF